MLGERMTLGRLMAVIVAFAGVLVVIRPASAVLQWASMLILGSAACYGPLQVATRHTAGALARLGRKNEALNEIVRGVSAWGEAAIGVSSLSSWYRRTTLQRTCMRQLNAQPESK